MPISCELRLGAFSARGAALAVASVEATQSRGDQCKVEVLLKVEHGRVGQCKVKEE